MPECKFDRFKIVWIYNKDISPHPQLQRPFNKKHGDAIAADFDPDKFLPLLVVPARKEGHYYVFGGQHRHYGALIALGENQKVPCHVFDDAPIETLAAIVLGTDRVLNWRPLDRWKIRTSAKEPVPVAIEAVLRRNELHVSKARGEGTVQAVAALEAVFLRDGGEAGLERTLKILTAAYGRQTDAYDQALLRGGGYLTHIFDGKLDDQELATKLAKHSGPGRMVGQARDKAKSDGISVERAAAAKMLMVYNQGRRAGRLVLPSAS